MEHFVDSRWKSAVTLGYNETIAKNAKKIVNYCENNYILHGHQWRCDVAGKIAILLKPGEGYEWHFDNLDYADKRLTTSRPKRFWTHIIYLTEGKPFEIGSWSPKGSRVEQTDFSAPEPETILARIYPKPGLSVCFPCFMVHRIQPVVDNRRWAFVDFIDTPDYLDNSKKDLKILFNRYFDEDTRRQLLSPR